MTEFLVGMDVGQKQDHTAIAVIQRVQRGTGYELRHVERVNLNTPVQQVVERAEHLLRTPQLWGRSTLALDATGAGLPVVDLLKSRGICPVAITITSGKDASQVGISSYRVPKRELVRTLVTLLESGRLRCALGLPFGKQFIEELLVFQLRLNRRTGRASYGSGSGSVHDDLVLAVALACWYGEQSSGARKLNPAAALHLP